VTPPLEEERNKDHNKKERELWGGTPGGKKQRL
jgi:hypothetical protein